MSFAAKWAQPCAYGDDIEPGDECTFVDDEPAHVDCPAKHAEDVPATVCPRCYLDHKGECF